MLVASDTSPISNLAIIGRLSLLQKQFQEIWISIAVESELSKLPNPKALASVEQGLRDRLHQEPNGSGRINGARFKIRPWSGRNGDDRSRIGATNLVLLDERAGRAAAARAGLRVTGVLGVLLRAKMQGDIPMLKPDLLALRSKARFFIAAKLEEEVLQSAGE